MLLGPAPSSLLPAPSFSYVSAPSHFGRVRANLVEDHRDVGSAGEKLRVSALYEVSIALFGFDDDEDFVHESSHGKRDAGLAKGRHVER